MIHYDIAMGVIEIIQYVACDNHDNFQHLNFISSQKKKVSLFWGLFNDETDLN
jgi:hypothetical protein